MTLGELKSEAKAHGYKLMPIVPYIKLLPCKCGRKKPEQWFLADGSNLTYFKCRDCDFAAPGAKTEREARKNWNAMVEGVCPPWK